MSDKFTDPVNLTVSVKSLDGSVETTSSNNPSPLIDLSVSCCSVPIQGVIKEPTSDKSVSLAPVNQSELPTDLKEPVDHVAETWDWSKGNPPPFWQPTETVMRGGVIPPLPEQDEDTTEKRETKRKRKRDLGKVLRSAICDSYDEEISTLQFKCASLEDELTMTNEKITALMVVNGLVAAACALYYLFTNHKNN